jgi:lipoyl(octanoyl) transferase
MTHHVVARSAVRAGFAGWFRRMWGGSGLEARAESTTPIVPTPTVPERPAADELSSMEPAPSAAAPSLQLQPVEWLISDAPVAYDEAVAFMEARVAAISEGRAPELIWLLEHPPLYTAGTSAVDDELVQPARFPVHKTGRGGRYTYHGPGQRVAYVMLDVRRRGGDVRAFVTDLEGWVIDTLAAFNVRGETRRDRVGVWVRRPEKGAGVEDKIAAIGIRLRRWISFHGVSINVEPELSHFEGIVPCGIRDQGVTSFADLGLTTTMTDVDIALLTTFEQRFGPAKRVERP